MAEFNISHSKIEQLNDVGDNVKIANNRAPVVVSEKEVIQTTGDGNKIQVERTEDSSLLSKFCDWIKGLWTASKK